jgi:hypothetical protein
MPLEEIIVNGGQAAQIAAFADACSKIWGNAVRLTVERTKKPKREIVNARVIAVIGKEGPIDDSRACIDRIVAIVEADAERNGSGDYRFAVLGNVSVAKKTARTQEVPSPELTELHAQVIRFGEEEAAEGEGGMFREVAKLVQTISSAIAPIAQASETSIAGMQRVIDIQNTTIAAQATAIGTVMTIENQHTEGKIRLAEIEYKDRRDQHKETVEERRYQEQRSDAIAAQAAEAKQRAELIEFGKGALMEGLAFMKQKMEDDKREKARKEAEARGDTVPPDPPRAEPPPSVSLPQSLAAAIAHLTEAQHDKLREGMGQTDARPYDANNPSAHRPTHAVWDLIVGASKQPDDAAAMTTLRNITTTAELAKRVNETMNAAFTDGTFTQDQANAILGAFRRLG